VTAEQTAYARLARPGLAPLVDELARRYRDGDTVSTVTLRALSIEQRHALADLLGTAKLPGERTRLPLSKVTAAVGVDSADELRGLVERLRGPILDHRSARLAERRERQLLWEWLRAELGTVALTTDAKALESWLDDLRSAGARGGVEAHRRRLQAVVAVLRLLPADGVTLAGLANDVLGDPHGFDHGRSVAAMVLDAVARIRGESRPLDAEAVRVAWERVGVAPDPLSSTVLTLGLSPTSSSDDPVAAVLRAMSTVHEPVVLTLAQLRRWPVRCPPSDAAGFVVENPSLIAEAAARGWAGPPLVCSSGRPTVAVLTLLRQLHAHGGTIYQHADFDPVGLAITAWLADRAETVPWRMNATDYTKAVGSADRHRPPITGPVPATPWDPTLSAVMASVRCAVYEEEVRVSLLDAINSVARRGH
jgi:uncharacterized protein (TIGR02679 family)